MLMLPVQPGGSAEVGLFSINFNIPIENEYMEDGK